MKSRTPSDFEKIVLSTPAQVIERIKNNLRHAYNVAGAKCNYSDKNLSEAIDALDTVPGKFLNLNRLYRDVIIEAITEAQKPN